MHEFAWQSVVIRPLATTPGFKQSLLVGFVKFAESVTVKDIPRTNTRTECRHHQLYMKLKSGSSLFVKYVHDRVRSEWVVNM